MQPCTLCITSKKVAKISHKFNKMRFLYLVVDLKQDAWPALESPGRKVDVDGVAPEGRLSLLGLVHLRLTLDPTLNHDHPKVTQHHYEMKINLRLVVVVTDH